MFKIETTKAKATGKATLSVLLLELEMGTFWKDVQSQR